MYIGNKRRMRNRRGKSKIGVGRSIVRMKSQKMKNRTKKINSQDETPKILNFQKWEQ